MAEICHEIEEWIEEEVAKPVNKWVERQEERRGGHPRKWWVLCLNKLVCWLVTVLVKVVAVIVVMNRGAGQPRPRSSRFLCAGSNRVLIMACA
ncbi:MAG: hypothetical protein ACTS27_01110 [Phycisphaerales bacterium]